MEHFNLLNAKRAEGFSCPLGSVYPANPTPLVFDCRLWRASQLHSQDMGDNGYFSHYSQEGRSPWDRAEAQGISAHGENVAAGNAGAQAVLDQWLGSDGHCRNMGNAGFKMAAVGYAYSAASPYGHYWTQMFKSNLVEADTSCLLGARSPPPPPVPPEPPFPPPAPPGPCSGLPADPTLTGYVDSHTGLAITCTELADPATYDACHHTVIKTRCPVSCGVCGH